jgi:hypothetical protein
VSGVGQGLGVDDEKAASLAIAFERRRRDRFVDRQGCRGPAEQGQALPTLKKESLRAVVGVALMLE